MPTYKDKFRGWSKTQIYKNTLMIFEKNLCSIIDERKFSSL